jgi:hypothetical protein
LCILENENPGVNHEHSSRIAEGYNLIEAPLGTPRFNKFFKRALLKEVEALTETVPTLPV